MGRYGTIDYPRYAKGGFLLGVALFVVGAVGSLAGASVLGTLPAWESTMFFDMEVLGILSALFSPLIFGIVLPMTE